VVDYVSCDFVSMSHGKLFVNFTPAISTSAAKAIRDEIRGWRLQLCSDQSIEDLSRMFNPISRGWLAPLLRAILSLCGVLSLLQLDKALARWGRHRNTRAFAVVNDVPSMGRPVVPVCSGAVRSLANGEGRFCCGSRMNADVHVRF
jgi:hypothetical protein